MKNYVEAHKFALENPVPETVEQFEEWLEQINYLISEVVQPYKDEKPAQPERKLPEVVIYTDGACSGNPGPGGYGAVLLCGKHKKELSGYDPATTNNKMELTAVIVALETLKVPCPVVVYTDSAYVQQNFSRVETWKANGWKTASKNSVANADLWQKLWDLAHEKCTSFRIEKVAGHAGVELNERCDELATSAIKNH